LRLRADTSTALGQMTPLFVALLVSLRATIRCRLELAAEILVLRHHYPETTAPPSNRSAARDVPETVEPDKAREARVGLPFDSLLPQGILPDRGSP
jgi:hypothetical protein